ncbi:MAG TPA: secretion system protein E [Rhodospirillaceae bacterium]|nr:secretion system protein E [Rhodospirillaceae bacterium]
MIMKTRLKLVEKNEEESEDILGNVPLLLGEDLIEEGFITPDQLRIALHEQKTNPSMLGAILLQLGFVDQDRLALLLARRAGVESVDLETIRINPKLLHKLPKTAAKRSLCLPLSLRGNKLEVAMADPFDIVGMDEIKRHFPRFVEIIPRVASRASIENLIETLYGTTHSIEAILKELESGEINEDEDSYEHPIVKLVNTLLLEAVARGASDIHFEPEPHFVRIRLRLDGTLRQIQALHLSHWAALSHRLKIMAGMNIADTRSIQDGRFQLNVSNAEVDFRVAIMPTVWGETIAVRLLDHRRSLLPLDKLGYSSSAQERLDNISKKPQGITLFTGPTGSGKTTTLYSLLQKLSSTEVHVTTLEEPVEFQLDLIRQTSIQETQGLDFAAGVRGLLRMDPDIIFIGEIRDSETAQMALRAAMTGHQVYSTLHCNDALGALPRLIDLGLNPRLLAGNLSGLVAQRLVRKLCPTCKRMRRATTKECQLLRVDPASPPSLAEAKGCDFCDHTGLQGRTVIAEVLPVSLALDDLISADKPRPQLMKKARQEGFVSLQEDGIARVLAQDISLAELHRTVDLSRGDGT